MNYKNYYEMLGVESTADQIMIKRAYRRLARLYHPDLNGSDAEAESKLKEINEAYSVLSDQRKRQTYDQHGSQWSTRQTDGGFSWGDWFTQQEQASGATADEARNGSNQNGAGWTAGDGASDGHNGQQSSSFYTNGTHTNGVHVNGAHTNGTQTNKSRANGYRGQARPEEENDHGQENGFTTFFNHFFGGEEGQEPRRTYTTGSGPTRNHNQTLPIEITLEESFWGATRTIQQGNERFSVSIPKGVQTGTKVRITREQYGAAGQLTMLVTVRPHQLFAREGDDLHVQVDVDLFTALLGGEIEVPTLEGSLMLVVPPDSQNGTQFRLKRQGMPRLKAPETRGDLLVEMRVALPVPLSAEAKRRVKELRLLHQGRNDYFS